MKLLVCLAHPQPKVVTDTDETELQRQLERLERENAEVDGDDDAEEMEAKAEDWPKWTETYAMQETFGEKERGPSPNTLIDLSKKKK